MVGIKIDADVIHIVNDNGHKNGVDVQNNLSGFNTLGQRGDEHRAWGNATRTQHGWIDMSDPRSAEWEHV